MGTHPRVALLLVALVVGQLGRTVGAQSVVAARVFTIENLRLERDQVLAFTMHPTNAPMHIRSSSRSLEVCPSTSLGTKVLGPASGIDSSWPRSAGFTECVPVDAAGRATLPGVSFHLGIVVRERGGRRVSVDRFTLRYQPQDGYFFCIPPPIEPGRDRTQFIVVPQRSATVGAKVFGSYEAEPAPSIRLRVKQGGLTVQPETQVIDESGRYPSYGTRAGKRVVLTLRNRADERRPFALAVDWS